MSVNRFTGPVGPCVGTIIIPIAAAAANTAFTFKHHLPAGMGFTVLSAYAYAPAVTSDPSITVGTTTAATALVAAVNLTTNLGALTVKSAGAAYAAGATIQVTVTNDTNDAVAAGHVQLIGYYTGFPTAVTAAIERS